MSQIAFTVEVDDLETAQIVVNNLGWDTVEADGIQLRIVAPDNLVSNDPAHQPTIARAMGRFWSEYADQLDRD